jgi:isopenicillin N synthase-like dioxygenase
MAFSEIPILDLSEARSNETKPEFLRKLRDALLNVGFLYIKNFGIDQSLCDLVCDEGIKFFDLPYEEKLRIEMKNQASFLGYSRVRLITCREPNDLANSASLGTKSQR